jgi:hypothetical protein
MIWFEKGRIPDGSWPFLNTVRASLVEFERGAAEDIDLTEGEPGITITGCLRVYRNAVVRRVLELAQSAVALWNSGLPLGAIAVSRALLETIGIYHSLLTRAEAAAASSDWPAIGRLVRAYALSSSSEGKKTREQTDEGPPGVGKAVRDFITATEPGAVAFWDQICDTAHPNGKRMLKYAGTLADGQYIARSTADNEPTLFVALYNALYSCCWLRASDLEFDILLERIRTGEALPPEHPLMVERDRIGKVTAEVAREIGSLRPGPREK